MKKILYTLFLVAGMAGVICTAQVAGSSVEPAPHDVAGMMQLHSSRTPYELATLSLPLENI